MSSSHGRPVSANADSPGPTPKSAWSKAVDASTVNLPPLECMMIPTIYVHAISQNLSPAADNVVWFTAVSLVAKVVMQEVAKHYILKRKTGNLRSMSVVVVVLTVMVDA